MRIRLPFFAPGPLAQLCRILDDPEVSDNDCFPKCAFVIYSMHLHPNEGFTSNLEIGQAPHY